ncbi:MAG: HU family DNA-binding protein [Desulfovibrio sp.]|nr:HU family DNA-binding protein [Desulfovibrio sp.]
MNKTQFIEYMASKTGFPVAHAEKILGAVLATIEDALFRDQRLTLRGLGTFEVRGVAARTGRNPRTGEAMQLEAYKTVRFRPAPAIRDYLE